MPLIKPIPSPIALPLVRPIAAAVGAAFAGFSPASLFANGEQGAWYDPSDFATLFQDSAGTTPVTATGQPVGRMLDKSGRGNHATQATAASRPVLQQDGNGKYYLAFDGVDDFLAVGLALSAYPLSLATAALAGTNHTGGILSLNTSDAAYKQISKAAGVNEWIAQDRNAANLIETDMAALNVPHVLVAEFGVAALELRVDGVSDGTLANTNAFGTSVSLFVGKTRPLGLFLSGRVYGALALARAMTAAERANTERFLANRSGVTL